MAVAITAAAFLAASLTGCPEANGDNGGRVYHTVAFITYDATVFITRDVPHGGNATEPYPAPVRTSHEFTGWFTEAAGGAEFAFAATAITAPINVYAQWEEVPLISWTVIEAGTGLGQSTFTEWVWIRGIAYGNGTFVAVGYTNGMARSTDNGATWTAIPAGTSAGQNTFSWGISRIAFGSGAFIAVGEHIAHSGDNGVTWTAIPAGTGAGQNTFPADAWIDHIVYGSGTFFTLGGNPRRMARSTDNGVTWAAFETGIAGSSAVVAYGNGTFIAHVSSGGRISMAYSVDNGVTWTVFEAGTVPEWISGSMAYGNGTFIALGSEGRMARGVFNR